MAYDLIVVGGGIGGSCLAAAMARTGAQVLVCERELEFRDRIRGEGMHPWGVEELRRLGMHEAIAGTCGHEARHWKTHVGGALIADRDLVETTPGRAGSLNFYHPAMQEAALGAARAAGAEVLRGAVVRGIEPGESPALSIEHEGATRSASARLVVVAAGRGSKLQAAAGFERHKQPPFLVIAGMLVEDLPIDPGAVRMCLSGAFDRLAICFPQGNGRVRAYVAHRHDDPLKLSGPDQRERFLELLGALDPEVGALPAPRPEGPLASFHGAAEWTDAVHRDGVVLMGDAAGTVDPSFGCGLSLTARDARVLSEALQEDSDWRAAADRFAEARRAYYQAQLRIEAWMREILYTPGPEGDAVRAVALPRMGEAGPDIVGLGPDSPHDDAAREALFGPLASQLP